MSAEVEGLIRAGTFTLAAKVPIGCNVIDARWVFKWKADEIGKIVKAKARLVAKGFKQKYGVDYVETFSPTANAASHRLVVALACKYNLELLHWDIEQAFVQSELDYEVFMKLPPGCGSMSGKVVRLNKSLYELKQESRTFYNRLVSELKRIGFEQSMSDPCVLRFMMGDEVVGMVAIHVDDILYAGTKSLAEVVVAALGDSLPTKNLGEVKFFLGCEYIRDREAGTKEISQESYIRSVLDKFNVCSTSSTPASPANDNNRSLKEDEGAKDVPFREVVGSLMWIANRTRCDINIATRAVARQSHNPKKRDWKASQKILNYLLETAHLTLKFKPDNSVDASTLVYVDADFASKANDRRSVSGAIVLVASMPVVWISKTQKCVSQSTSEAEYLAMGDGVKEALFVNGMLQFLRPSAKPRKIDVLEDNEGAIALAENPLSSSRSKHIDVRHHFLRNLTEEGVIEVTHVPSEEQHADILTKALPRDLFEVHRDFVLGSRKYKSIGDAQLPPTSVLEALPDREVIDPSAVEPSALAPSPLTLPPSPVRPGHDDIGEVLAARGEVPTSSSSHASDGASAIDLTARVLTRPSELAHRQRDDTHLSQARKVLSNVVDSSQGGSERDRYSLGADDVIRYNDGRPLEPWDELHMDILKIDTPSQTSNNHILLVVDRASKFPFGFPLETNQAVGVARVVVELCLTYGVPKTVRCDEGPEFGARLVKHLCRWLRANIVFGAADHPRGQGSVERLGGWLQELLAELCRPWPDRWDEYVSPAMWIKRTLPDTSLPTYMTPFEFLFGRKPRTSLDSLVPLTDEMDQERGVDNFVERRKHNLREVGLVMFRLRCGSNAPCQTPRSQLI
ncbi:unnamed protein product [Ectocarpus sp. CCAP 1310/34]|nr:unnamed protein product [Ectocarpus sp. CCAP 1310/34]